MSTTNKDRKLNEVDETILRLIAEIKHSKTRVVLSRWQQRCGKKFCNWYELLLPVFEELHEMLWK